MGAAQKSGWYWRRFVFCYGHGIKYRHTVYFLSAFAGCHSGHDSGAIGKTLLGMKAPLFARDTLNVTRVCSSINILTILPLCLL